jgi:hypothetical protein
MVDLENVEERLFRAYWRAVGKNGYTPSGEPDYYEVDGKKYAALTNINGVLAAYRIRDNGSLKTVDLDWFEKHVVERSE